MGISSLPMYPTIMKSLAPIVLLMVSQECFDHFQKLAGIPDTWRMKIQAGCLEEGDTYFLFSSSGGPSSFHSSAQVLHFPLFLLAQAFKGCGQSLRVCGQICSVPVCIDCLNASLDTLCPCCMATASLRRYILCICASTAVVL